MYLKKYWCNALLIDVTVEREFRGAWMGKWVWESRDLNLSLDFLSTTLNLFNDIYTQFWVPDFVPFDNSFLANPEQSFTTICLVTNKRSVEADLEDVDWEVHSLTLKHHTVSQHPAHCLCGYYPLASTTLRPLNRSVPRRHNVKQLSSQQRCIQDM